MTSIAERDRLQAAIWKIANEVRGAVDGWDFKQFVLGTLFYRFISENFTAYIEGGDAKVLYEKQQDEDITPDIKKDAINTKGYFIYPSQLFTNLAGRAETTPELNVELRRIFDEIEGSAIGHPSERDLKGLFADFDTSSPRLGATTEEKNRRLIAVIKGVAGLDFGAFEENQIDLFGDAYEFLISNYAANAGKSGGEFFTPQNVSKLIAQLALHGLRKVNKIYDPACGSGSLLLQAKKQFDAHQIEEGFFGQEINHTTYNLARMNMFLHNVNYDKFDIALGDTLLNPQFGDQKPFDAIVSNPPYSVSWVGDRDSTLINDARFAPAGVLAPKSKADFAFVLHALSYLSGRGRAAIVCYPGIFYRGGAEQKIRKYLVDSNFVETVIALPPNLFYGTSIAVNVLVLSRHKADCRTQFINASGPEFFRKETNNNVLTDAHVEQIVRLFAQKEEVRHVAHSVEYEQIVANDYRLSVEAYVEPEDTREEVDIAQLNAEIAARAVRINQLRAEIDDIIPGDRGMSELWKLLRGREVEWRPLGEVGTFARGQGLQKRDFTPTGVGCIHYGQIYTHYGTWAEETLAFVAPATASGLCKVHPGDVVITNTSENVRDVCKAVAWLGRATVVTGGHATVFTPGEATQGKYVAYYMQTECFARQKRQYARGSKVIDVSATDLAKIRIPLPPLDVQERIVGILDRFASLEAELEAELEARKLQYAYYRDLLFTTLKGEISPVDAIEKNGRDGHGTL